MAEKEIKFRVTLENGEQIEKTAKSLDDLAEAQRQTQAALNKTTIGTDDYKKLSGELKNIDKSMASAKTSTMGFGEKIGALGGPIGGAVNGFMGLAKSALAFLATPIGAVVGVLGVVFAAVTKAIKSNEAAMDALTKVTDIFSGIVQPLFDFLANIATAVLEGVANGLAAVADFFGLAGSEAAKFSEQLDNQQDIEKDLAVSRAQTNKQLAEAREILSDSNATYAERTAALKKVQAAEQEQSAKEVANKKELLRLAEEQLKIDGASEENIQKIRDAKIALAQVEQDSAAKQRQFNKQQKSLDKEAADAEKEKQKEAEAAAKEAAAKRKAAADKAAAEAKARRDAALALQKEGLKAEQKAIDDAYLLSIADQDVRAQEALKIQQRNQDAELQVKIDGLEKIKKRTKEENDALAALKAQQSAEDIAQQKTLDELLAKQQADKLKAKKDADQKAADDFKKLTDEEYAATVKSTDDYYKQLTTALINSNLTQEELQKQSADLELQRLEQQKLNAQDYGLSIIDIEQQIALKKKEIADAEDAAQKERNATRMEQFQGIMQTATAVTGAVQAIQEAQMQRELQAAGDNQAKQEEIKKKYFEKNKKVQIANAIIGTIQGAVQAFTSLASIPIIGPVLGGIAAAAALVAGYANVAKIRATQYEGGGGGGGGSGGGGGEAPPPAPVSNTYADGGYVSGSGTSRSDSISARLSNGESVINANSTAQFGGLLSMINQAGGGKAFASGGVATNNPVGQTNMTTPIIKTYVVASDMTLQQEADAKIKRLAQL